MFESHSECFYTHMVHLQTLRYPGAFFWVSWHKPVIFIYLEKLFFNFWCTCLRIFSTLNIYSKNDNKLNQLTCNKGKWRTSIRAFVSYKVHHSHSFSRSELLDLVSLVQTGQQQWVYVPLVWLRRYFVISEQQLYIIGWNVQGYVDILKFCQFFFVSYFCQHIVWHFR